MESKQIEFTFQFIRDLVLIAGLLSDKGEKRKKKGKERRDRFNVYSLILMTSLFQACGEMYLKRDRHIERTDVDIGIPS